MKSFLENSKYCNDIERNEMGISSEKEPPFSAIVCVKHFIISVKSISTAHSVYIA